MNMNFHLTKSSFDGLEKLDESSSINTLKRKSQLSSNEIIEISDDAEVRILNWLQENGIFHGIPEEKEYRYYESKRDTAQSSSSGICLDSSLFHRRRNSLPSNHKEMKSPLKNSKILKLSKFQTCNCIESPCYNIRCSLKKAVLK